MAAFAIAPICLWRAARIPHYIEVIVKPPHIPTLLPAPTPAAKADAVLPPAAEVLVYPLDPATPPGAVPVFSSSDDMDFDIVSTRR